jgi:Tfp pilus assembly protein PilZ
MASRSLHHGDLHPGPESADDPSVQDHLSLFREYAVLERKRKSGGVSPLEYQRWVDLDQRLGSKFHKNGEAADRRDTRLLVEFHSPEDLRRAYISELTRGGVFINTPFAPEIGTELVLRVRIHTTQQTLELPGVIASNNVSGGFSTEFLGIGVHFRKLEPETRLALDDLFAGVGRPVGED